MNIQGVRPRPAFSEHIPAGIVGQGVRDELKFENLWPDLNRIQHILILDGGILLVKVFVFHEYDSAQGYGPRDHPRIFIVVAGADEHTVLREAVVRQHIPHQEGVDAGQAEPVVRTRAFIRDVICR